MRLALLLCLLSGLTAAAQTQPQPTVKQATDGRVWGALVYASAGEKAALPPGVPSSLKDLPDRLSKVFTHFSRFEIIGQQPQDILRQYESWVVPTKDLFLKLDSKGHSDSGGLKLDLQFWREKQILVKTDVVLQKESPLFIGGPKWRDGQMIFVLLLTQE